MGWSPWHAKYGWARPADVVEQDFNILRDLHVNALRTWGGVTRAGADSYWRHNISVIPQVSLGKVPRMRFADGKEGGEGVNRDIRSWDKE